MSNNKDLELVNPAENVFVYSIQGHSNSNILEYLESQNLTTEKAKQYIEEALEKFIKSSKLPKSVRRGWCLEAYRELYRKLFETGDYSAALKAVKEISKLSDLESKNNNDYVSDKDEIDDYINSMLDIDG